MMPVGLNLAPQFSQKAPVPSGSAGLTFTGHAHAPHEEDVFEPHAHDHDDHEHTHDKPLAGLNVFQKMGRWFSEFFGLLWQYTRLIGGKEISDKYRPDPDHVH